MLSTRKRCFVKIPNYQYTTLPCITLSYDQYRLIQPGLWWGFALSRYLGLLRGSLESKGRSRECPQGSALSPRSLKREWQAVPLSPGAELSYCQLGLTDFDHTRYNATWIVLYRYYARNANIGPGKDSMLIKRCNQLIIEVSLWWGELPTRQPVAGNYLCDLPALCQPALWTNNPKAYDLANHKSVILMAVLLTDQ